MSEEKPVKHHHSHKDGGKKLCEEWKKAKGTSNWNYAGASGMGGWPNGMELSEEDYDKAVADFAGAVLR